MLLLPQDMDECREYTQGLRKEFLNGPPYSAYAGGEWSEEVKALVTEHDW